MRTQDMLFAHGPVILPPLFKFSPIPALRNFSIMDQTPSFSIYRLVSYWLSSLFIRVLCNHLLTIQALCNPFTCYLGTMQLSFLYICYIRVLCNLLFIIQKCKPFSFYSANQALSQTHQENVQYNFGQLSQLSKVVKLLKLCKLWQLSKVRYKNF